MLDRITRIGTAHADTLEVLGCLKAFYSYTATELAKTAIAVNSNSQQFAAY